MSAPHSTAFSRDPSGPRPAPATPHHAPERLDRRFLVRLLVVLALVAGAWYGLHAWQTSRLAPALLAAARQAREQKRLDEAESFLGAYLARRPDDQEARVQLAEVKTDLADTAPKRRAIIPLYAEVLEKEPDRHDLRRRLVKLAIGSGQYELAAEHLEKLRQAFPDDPEVLEELGDCRSGLGEYKAASRLYEQCLKRRTDRLEVYVKLARLWLKKLGSARDAEAWLEQMVVANSKSVQAWLTRADFRRRQGQLAAAERDVVEALALDPGNPQALFLGARLASSRADGQARARKYLETLIDKHPKAARAYEALARLDLDEGNAAKALEHLRLGLQKGRCPDEPGLLWNQAYLLIQTGDVGVAEAAVDQAAAHPRDEAHTTFLRAALEIRQGKWRDARVALEEVRPQLIDDPAMSAQLDLLVGRCQERLGDPSGALLAYRRSIDADPLSGPARLGAVSALLQQGRHDTALEECGRLVEMPRAPVNGWLILARLLIEDNFRRPAARRKWQSVEEALDRAAVARAVADEAEVLRAEVLLGKGDAKGARSLLEKARDRSPNRVIFRIALAELAQNEGRWDDAEKTLDEAVRVCGDGVDLRLARARLRGARGGAGAAEGLAALERKVDSWSQADRVRLLYELGIVYYQAGKKAEARDRWRRVAELAPSDLMVRLLLFDVAQELDDEAGMREALEAIRGIEGPGGALGRYDQARVLIRAARKGDRSGLGEARELLTLVGRERPQWSRVPLALAEADEVEQKLDSAVDNYQRAVDLGERRLSVVRRLVQLLYERKRYAAADEVLRKLPDQTPAFGDLQRLATHVSLEVKDWEQALAHAHRAVPADSKDPAEQRWLGQVLSAAGRTGDAEAAFRKAVALAPADADNWVALIQLLARGNKAKAEEALREARAKLPAKGAELALAQCYAALDQPERARELFRDALAHQPRDVAALQTATDFYLRVGDRAEAEKCLRALVALGGENPAAARRARALLPVVLAAGGDRRRAAEALAMMGLAGDHPAEPAADATPEELRARAVVLATQPERRRLHEAVRTLEVLDQRQKLTTEDRFLLAQLAERLGEARRLRDNLQLVLVEDGDNPRYVAYQVRVLIRQGYLSEAGQWLAALERSHPEALTTAELKARLLKAGGQGADAAAVLTERAAKFPAERLLLAGLLEELGQGAAAEPLYRALAAEKPEPERRLQLARCVGRQGKLDEALRICAEARTAAAPEEVAYATLEVLHAGRPSAAQLAEFRGWLEGKARALPRSAGLALCLADLADLEGRPAEAERVYRAVLAADPSNAQALNNLAWLLALHPGHGDEARRLAERALEILGPVPEVIDTRGLARLASGQTDGAVEDFQDAWRPTLNPRTLSSIRFHLARALEVAGKPKEAADALKEARKAGLTEATLHPLERPAWKHLLETLPQDNPKG
jgi:tetratricopeptide (TPR) repeat protein